MRLFLLVIQLQKLDYSEVPKVYLDFYLFRNPIFTRRLNNSPDKCQDPIEVGSSWLQSAKCS